MPWTLFKLQWVHIRPPSSHRGHSFVPLRHQGSYPNTEETKLARLQPGYSLLCFTVFCELPASQELHKGSKEMDVTGHYIKTDHVLQNFPNQSQVLLATGDPVISISLDPLTSTWLKSDLRQTSTCSKLSPPGYRHLTTISSTLRYMPGYHTSDQWRSNAYHPITTRHVHIGVVIKFAALFF